MGGMIILHRQADLAEVIPTSGSSCGFACGLDGRKQEGHKDPDDRDHDQQFDKRKTATATGRIRELYNSGLSHEMATWG